MSRWPQRDPVAGDMTPRPALFLDRDGVLVLEKDYLRDPDQVEMFPGVPDALRRAREAGYLLIGVSNQSGLGRGHFTLADFEAVMRRLDGLLRAADVPLDGFFYCPHAPEQDCNCRKPATGLLAEAAAVFAWQPQRSWVIGDKLSDIDLALNAGLRPCLVRTGYGTQQEHRLGDRAGVLVADDLEAAVRAILEGA